MSAQKEKQTPRLQPPGAGLSLLQRVVIRTWLEPVVSKRTSRQESRAAYEAYTKKIIQLASATAEHLRAQKVLIDPLPGLEDSSRYWSVNDTLEHLMIASTGMEGVILSLAAGKVPPGEVDIAKVKPHGAEGDLLSKFSAYAPGLMARIDQRLAGPEMDPRSPLKFRHPWFGEINAHQWYWLLGAHQGIHYRQLRAIVARF